MDHGPWRHQKQDFHYYLFIFISILFIFLHHPKILKRNNNSDEFSSLNRRQKFRNFFHLKMMVDRLCPNSNGLLRLQTKIQFILRLHVVHGLA